MTILNPHGYKLPQNLSEYFCKIYSLFLKKFNLPDYDIEILILDEDQIRDLNSKYRNKDESTDVLSFPMNPESFENFLGAIYFCYPVITKNNGDALYEFCLLFVHSCLHLLGYQHGEEMFAHQKDLVDSVFNERN